MTTYALRHTSLNHKKFRLWFKDSLGGPFP
jgi:hypothetical protein